jgi:hypothetical protein
MSLDKAIKHGKEKRKLNKTGKYCDRMNGGCDHSCPPCMAQRKYKIKKAKGSEE